MSSQESSAASTGVLLVVSGLSVVPTQQQSGLVKFILRKSGASPANTGDTRRVYMPHGDNGNSFGVAFVRFADEQAAQRAIESTNGTAIDINHTWRIEHVTSSQIVAEMRLHGQVDETLLDAVVDIS